MTNFFSESKLICPVTWVKKSGFYVQVKIVFEANKDLTYDKSDWTQTVVNINSIYVIFVENVRSVVKCPARDAFYPTALKGRRGIVFTHGVRMGGRREKVCPGCSSETVRCRKLILGRDIC